MLSKARKRGTWLISGALWLWLGGAAGLNNAQAAESRHSPIVETIKAVKDKIGGGAAPTGTAASSDTANAAPPQVILRLHGAPALGNSVVPKLVTHLLEQRGHRTVETVKLASEEVEIVGQGTPSGRREKVEIKTFGTAAGFAESQAFKQVGLEKKFADIAIASRRIKPEEAAKLQAAGVGNPYSPLAEHVVALDGLAVFVHPGNPIAGLSLDELRRIYLHEVSDWGQVHGVDANGQPVQGKPGPITLYCGHCRVSGGAYDTFKQMVLGNVDIEFSASYLKILETFEDIQHSLANDPNGIGFSSATFQSSASKPLKLGRGGAYFEPDALHIKTGEYPLAHNLYFYTPEKKSPLVAQFVALALSPTGQQMVIRSGLVSPSASGEQTIRQMDAVKRQILNDPKIPAAYKTAVQGADRSETLYNLRFETGSGQLDNKSLVDVGRLVQTLRDPRNKNATVLLIGFSDSRGDAEVNQRLSVARAKFVAEVLKTQGITRVETMGFGEEPSLLLNPVENSPEAQKDNRRVEVWLRRGANPL